MTETIDPHPKKEGKLLVFYSDKPTDEKQWRKVIVSLNKYGMKFTDIKDVRLFSLYSIEVRPLSRLFPTTND